MPTQRLPRYPQQPNPHMPGPWNGGGPVPRPTPYGSPDPREQWTQLPAQQPGRRRQPPKPSGVQLSTAVTFALLAFALGFLGGVALFAAVVLQRP